MTIEMRVNIALAKQLKQLDSLRMAEERRLQSEFTSALNCRYEDMPTIIRMMATRGWSSNQRIVGSGTPRALKLVVETKWHKLLWNTPANHVIATPIEMSWECFLAEAKECYQQIKESTTTND